MVESCLFFDEKEREEGRKRSRVEDRLRFVLQFRLYLARFASWSARDHESFVEESHLSGLKRTKRRRVLLCRRKGRWRREVEREARASTRRGTTNETSKEEEGTRCKKIKQKTYRIERATWDPRILTP